MYPQKYEGTTKDVIYNTNNIDLKTRSRKKEQKKTQVKPVTKKTNLKQKIPATTAPQQQCDNILIRTSPKPLFDTLHTLSRPQKQYMREIGSDLLDITVDGIKTHIGFYAVSNFDCEKMVLNVNGVSCLSTDKLYITCLAFL